MWIAVVKCSSCHKKWDEPLRDGFASKDIKKLEGKACIYCKARKLDIVSFKEKSLKKPTAKQVRKAMKGV